MSKFPEKLYITKNAGSGYTVWEISDGDKAIDDAYSRDDLVAIYELVHARRPSIVRGLIPTSFTALALALVLLLSSCAYVMKPVQSRSVCDALVGQVEGAKDAMELERASKVYQKHGCA